MPPRKTTPTNATLRPRTSRSGSTLPAVRIRMYNVGFGDCFLLFVPTEAGERKILIDCGSIKQARHPMREIVGSLIDDIRGADGIPHVDLLIATHRHKDHISGFDDPRWHEVSVGEVWLPWTEQEDDSDATRLRLLQTRFSEALAKLLDDGEAQRKGALLDIVANARSNRASLEMLHRGFRGRPTRRFLPEKGKVQTVLLPAMLPGVDVHVLGPPHDERALAEMNPAPGEAYLAALEHDAAGHDSDEQTFRFGWDWVIDDSVATDHLDPWQRLSRRDKAAVQRHAEERDWELLAASADNAINNTSLILMIRVGAAYLLFPGDAQWGPWRQLLDDAETSRLLEKTTFYKVGHHGSHNATPPRFVEQWRKGASRRSKRWSMMSVTPDARYDDIPRAPLVDELERTVKRLVRSDLAASADGLERSGEMWVELSVPTA